MAYQNVSTPRIYLNIPEYLASTGVAIDDVFRTLPVKASAISSIPVSAIANSGITLNNNKYIAILGHSANSIGLTLGVGESSTDIINGTIDSVKKGFSIIGLPSIPTGISFSGNAGSILLGTYFDFPHSPDLSLTLSYDYSGIKETTTKGGATLTNAFYTKPPKWTTGLGAWELEGGNAAHAKSGRRIWNLSFSFLSDSSVFPDNAGLVNETTLTDTTGSGDPDLTLLEDNTIFRTIHLCNGGQIPFIFQADNTVNSSGLPKPDSLAIAKFDMKAFQFQQVANGVYNIKLKIREVW